MRRRVDTVSEPSKRRTYECCLTEYKEFTRLGLSSPKVSALPHRHRFQRALFKNRTHKCSLVTEETFGFRVVFHCRLAFRIFRCFRSVLFIIGETWKCE